MIILDGQKEIEYEGNTRVVIGKFDGIHLGHRKLISMITGKEDSLKSVVFTFSRASKVFSDENERLLTEDKRREKFESLGVNYLVEYELNEKTSKMEPEEFARKIFKNRLHAAEVYCGPDLSFGYRGRGNVELLKSMEDELSIKVIVIDKVQYMGEDISSSRIREALLRGDVKDAEKMMEG